MRYENKDDTLKIFLEGNIDTTNADVIGKEMFNIKSANPTTNLILDLEKLNYISSSGLRQILKLRKACPTLKLINTNPDVYDIFSVTGFTDMMDIEKGYRQVSIEGLEKIGEGSNGIVYRIDPDTIIKVYKDSDAIAEIKQERELAKKALVMGINTAISYDIVKVGDYFGSVFEMVSAKSLTKLIKADPDNKDKYIKIFTNMLKEIHATVVPKGQLPDIKEITLNRYRELEGKIEQEVYDKLMKLVNDVPHTDTLIHGDYHTNNVHYANGEAILIDMDTLSVGHPVFEFASIYMAFVGFGEVDKKVVENFLNLDYETSCYIWKKTLEYYFEGTGIDIQDVEDKAKVLGYARVLRRTYKRDPNNQAMIDHNHQKLVEYVNKVDSLVF